MKAFMLLGAGVALTILCWGSYGPVLHKGQEALGGSKLKPWICVGVAYFVVAIVVPTIYLASRGELGGDWSFGGISWSLLAGTAGALGALGIIIAISSGKGSPILVMPLVFGGAPVLTVFISILFLRNTEQPNSWFYAGLILVVVGAVVVQVCAPKKLKTPSESPPQAAAGKSIDTKSDSASDSA